MSEHHGSLSGALMELEQEQATLVGMLRAHQALELGDILDQVLPQGQLLHICQAASHALIYLSLQANYTALTTAQLSRVEMSGFAAACDSSMPPLPWRFG